MYGNDILYDEYCEKDSLEFSHGKMGNIDLDINKFLNPCITKGYTYTHNDNKLRYLHHTLFSGQLHINYKLHAKFHYNLLNSNPYAYSIIRRSHPSRSSQ